MKLKFNHFQLIVLVTIITFPICLSHWAIFDSSQYSFRFMYTSYLPVILLTYIFIIIFSYKQDYNLNDKKVIASGFFNKIIPFEEIARTTTLNLIFIKIIKIKLKNNQLFFIPFTQDAFQILTKNLSKN